MYLTLSADQESFAHECRRLLEKECTAALVREVATPKGTGHSPRLHALLAGAGWFELAQSTPGETDFGTLFDLGLAFREAGRFLVPSTAHSCALAARVLRRCDSPRASELSTALASGEQLLTVAYLEDAAPDPYGRDVFDTVAVAVDDSWVLSGTKTFVLNAATADFLLVAAQVESPATKDQIALFLVPRQDPGVALQDLRTFGHDAQSKLTLSSVSLSADSLLAGPSDAPSWRESFRAAIDETVALLCMEMLGGLERVLEDTADYVNTRMVFSRQLATFQAVQHQLADVAIKASAGRVAALSALWAVAEGHEARRHVSIAKSWLATAYKDATLVAHQLYGGAGYVREADLHLWSQRAKACEPLYGARPYHLRRLADLNDA